MRTILLLLLVILVSCEKRIRNDDHLSSSSDSIITPLRKDTAADADSILISVSTKSTEGGIQYGDAFDNIYQLGQGKNRVPSPILLMDGHGRHQTHFLIDRHVQPVSFFIDSTSLFWVAQTDDEKLNKELNFEVSYRQEIAPIKTVDDIIFLFDKDEYLGNPEKRDQAIDTHFDEKMAYLKAYANKHQLSNKFLSDWQTMISYEKLSAKLFLNGELNQWPKEYLLELCKHIKDLNNNQYLYLPYYRNAAHSLERILYFLSHAESPPTIQEYYNSIDKNFKSKTKDYLLTSFLVYVKDEDFRIKHAKTTYDSLYQHYLVTCKTPEYKEYLQRKTLAETVPVQSGQLVTMEWEVVDFAKLLQKQRITYVDFWASWCAPCLAEMPDSKKLREDYQSKGVDFMYISLDKNAAAWERAAKQIGISASESFLLPKGKDSDIAQQFNITTIPRYLLIGQDRKIIDAEAPRPSDPAIRETLDALLNQ